MEDFKMKKICGVCGKFTFRDEPKEYNLKNIHGKLLDIKAFEIKPEIFIIGTRINDHELNCNSLPLTKQAIEKYGLIMEKSNR